MKRKTVIGSAILMAALVLSQTTSSQNVILVGDSATIKVDTLKGKVVYMDEESMQVKVIHGKAINKSWLLVYRGQGGMPDAKTEQRQTYESAAYDDKNKVIPRENIMLFKEDKPASQQAISKPNKK